MSKNEGCNLFLVMEAWRGINYFMKNFEYYFYFFILQRTDKNMVTDRYEMKN